ncbi:copper resistance protein CopC [Bacillus sp. sid0103]|uniref:copper resistance CopC family protein n=1 Tax=Bacillus sp. sid0103 TaxID=2856337 RepID=UPI001C4737A1|nr:copper resistance CopC family protein [Bacillus sp. sid0103]MBV7504210.1 copper resistance protein CopC [Bacillus sp. sid0103]
MKKLLLLLISMLVMIPTIASAHTEITSSNPAANQVVKEDLKEIVITYEGKIESLSTMKLVKDGQEKPLVSVTPKANQLVGTLSTPLENGSYTIKWNIAGEDGHTLKGEIPFTVQKEVKLDQKTETKEPVKKEETKKENAKQVQTNKQAEDSSTNMKTIITVAIVVILVIGLFLLFRRKR